MIIGLEKRTYVRHKLSLSFPDFSLFFLFC